MNISNRSKMLGILVGGFALMYLPLSLLAAEGSPRWSYEGDEGPDNWGELAEAYIMCSRGRNQSPIDLSN